jgi:hypothetical protein
MSLKVLKMILIGYQVVLFSVFPLVKDVAEVEVGLPVAKSKSFLIGRWLSTLDITS